MNESTLRAKLISTITSAGGHACAIESHATSAGIPDLNYCINGNEGHIELKVGTKRKPPYLRPTQHRWFVLRNRAKGKAFFLFLDNDTGNVYLIYGKDVQVLVEASTETWIRSAFASWDKLPLATQLFDCLLNE